MVSEPTASTIDSVAWFVADFSGINHAEIHSASSLPRDLRIDGDDAAELLDAFSIRYTCDLSGLEYHRYFSDEGALSVPGFLRWAAMYPAIPTSWPDLEPTIELLARAVELGSWPELQASAA